MLQWNLLNEPHSLDRDDLELQFGVAVVINITVDSRTLFQFGTDFKMSVPKTGECFPLM